jgi:hypothetical protein
MSLWGKIKKATKRVAKAASDFVKENLQAAASALAAPFRDVYNEFKHAFKGVWKWANGDKKGAREEWDKAKRAGREVISDIFGGAAGFGLIVAVNTVSFVQRVIGVEDEGRKLSKAERGYLEPIFRDTVDYDAVRIVEGDVGVLDHGHSVFTIGYKIRVPKASSHYPLTDPIHHHDLVHEMVHVWQFENGGPDYVPEAIIAQQSGGNGLWYDDNGYPNPTAAPPGYGFDTAVAAGKRWPDFNPEQQATFIDCAFVTPTVDFSHNVTTMMFNSRDYTAELLNALTYIRNREGVA